MLQVLQGHTPFKKLLNRYFQYPNIKFYNYAQELFLIKLDAPLKIGPLFVSNSCYQSE
jgi:hypothetical protein